MRLQLDLADSRTLSRRVRLLIMSSEKEQYYFYKLYSIDFDTARHILRVLRRYRRKDVRYSILRDLVVSYCRPFSGNKGSEIRKHMLTKKVVPKELRPLHDELVNLRNKLFAHTDYIYRRPKVINWSTENHKWFPMQFRGYDYNKLDMRVPEIEKLIQAVTKNLHTRIGKIEDNIEPVASGHAAARRR